MTTNTNPDGTVPLTSDGNVSLATLLALLAAEPVRAGTKAALDDRFAPSRGRVGITADDTVYAGTGDAWVPVETDVALAGHGYDSADGVVTLESGSATIDTGVQSSSAAFEVALAPAADAEVEYSVVRVDGTHQITISETNTAVGSFDVNYQWRQVRE